MTPLASSRPSPAPLSLACGGRRALLGLAALLALAGCGTSDDSSPAGASGASGASGSSGAAGAGSEPAVGTVEDFVDLDFPSEGIVVAKDAQGRAALFLGGQNAIWTLAADRAVTRLVDVPAPLGMARTAAGDVLVCGKLSGDAGSGPNPGAIWRVTPAGQATVQSGGTDAQAYALPNMIAVAPDDSVVFSDSKAGRVFHTAPDGSGSVLVTDQISYPNGVGFSPDGATLYVASYDTKRIFSLPRAADGSFGAPVVFAEDVENVDGISPLATGDLLLVTTGAGVVLLPRTGTKQALGAPASFTLPSNGAFGEGDLGAHFLYVSSLFQKEIYRVSVGQPGLTLPVR